MTDLEELKDALHSPPGFAPRVLDLDAVMAAGGRIRRRRRLTTGAGAALAVAVLLIGGSQVLDRPAPNRGGTAPAAVQSDPARPADMLGEPIRTGLPADGGGEYVLYGKTIDDPSLSEVSFGVMLARQGPDGGLTDLVMSNEVEGSDTAPGFHALQAATGPGMPVFGYYVGFPAVVKGTTGERQIIARTAVWSADARVTVFWFQPDDIGADGVRDVRAYDRDGKKLPTGNNSVGVG